MSDSERTCGDRDQPDKKGDRISIAVTDGTIEAVADRIRRKSDNGRSKKKEENP